MTQYVWTTVKVGGKATQATLDALDQLLADMFGPDGPTEAIADMIAAEAPMDASGERNFGNVDELIAFCRSHDLVVWAACSAASGVFGASIIYWAPGMAEPVSQECSDDGDPCLTLSHLLKEKEAGATIDDVIAALSAADSARVPPIALANDALPHAA